KIYIHEWSGLKTAEQVLAAARILEELGWVKIIEPKIEPKSEGGRRPSPKLAVHPQFRTQEKAPERR
ncbi:MAG TPA: hypothetical protein VGI19_11830, partial [Candidatus Cybelea sp.]